MKKFIISLLIMSVSYLGMINCWGSFALSRTVHKAYDKIQNKWIKSVVFMILIFFALGATLIVVWVDILVFNTYEFWAGKPLIGGGGGSRSTPKAKETKAKEKDQTKVFRKGPNQITMIHRAGGEELDFVLHLKGKEFKTLTIKRNEPGVFYLRQKSGLAKLSLDEINTDSTKLVILRAGAQVIGLRYFPENELKWIQEKEQQILADLPANQANPDPLERVQF